MSTAAASERDVRMNVLNTLLKTPHRDLASIYPVHQEMISQDPMFYGHLAAWYANPKNGDVRDHLEMFVINLILSDVEGHRDEGLALLRQMPPYQVVRVTDFIKGKKVKRMESFRTKQGKIRQKVVRDETGNPVWDSFGLGKPAPHKMKTEILRYLQDRERDDLWFDASVLKARKYLHRLYGLFRIKPSPRAQAIIFDDKPPADSKLFALKELAKLKDPTEQAKKIIELRIPYTVASSVIDQMSPTVILALVEVMTPQELMNSLGSLKEKGALENQQIRQLVDQKIDQAKSAKRVAAMKTDLAKAAAGDEELAKKLDDVADTQIKSKGRISKPTALLFDKSGSMETSIEVAKRIGSMISAVCEDDLFVYAFDTMPYPIQPSGKDLAAWERALKYTKAGGNTSCGIALEQMRRSKQKVEQIILVTDEGENHHPQFFKVYQDYARDLGVQPTVVIVKVPDNRGSSWDIVEKNCKVEGIDVSVWPFNGDYYSLPNLIPLLSRPSKMDLLLEIMNYPIPVRLSA